MKHLVKKAMLTGAFGCFLLGTALADNATASQDTKPYWQDVQVVAVNKELPRSSTPVRTARFRRDISFRRAYPPASIRCGCGTLRQDSARVL